MRPAFLLPFSHRHSLLGHPVPPGSSAPLTIGLPAVPARLAPDRVPVFHTRETRLGLAVLSTPGTAVSTRPRSILRRRLPPRNGRPLSPCAATRHRAFA
jgi:hypothetical protein